jgi:hypothetical protein
VPRSRTLIFAATAIYYLVFEGLGPSSVAAQTFFGGPIKLWYAIVIATAAPLVWRGSTHVAGPAQRRAAAVLRGRAGRRR